MMHTFADVSYVLLFFKRNVPCVLQKMINLVIEISAGFTHHFQ